MLLSIPHHDDGTFPVSLCTDDPEHGWALEAPAFAYGGVDRSMKAVAAPDVRELAAGECAARFGEACEVLARASITRFEKCRRRLGEDFAGLDISDKWRTEPAAAAWAPPGERPVIPRNLALDSSTEI